MEGKAILFTKMPTKKSRSRQTHGTKGTVEIPGALESSLGSNPNPVTQWLSNLRWSLPLSESGSA